MFKYKLSVISTGTYQDFSLSSFW